MSCEACAALDAEYGQVGFGRQGFTITGNGQVPPFFTPGVAVNSSWDKVYEGTPRSFKGLDFIFILHGTNDGLNQASCPLAGVVTSRARLKGHTLYVIVGGPTYLETIYDVRRNNIMLSVYAA